MKIKPGWYSSPEYDETVLVINMLKPFSVRGSYHYDYIDSYDDGAEFMSNQPLTLGKTWIPYTPSEKEMRNVAKVVFVRRI